MVSIFRMLFSHNNLVEVYRVPPTKSLRAHVLGQTLGLLFLAGHLGCTLTSANATVSLLIFLWFIIATYFGGLLMAVTLLSGVCVILAPGSANGFLLSCHWYTLGYLFGGLFALLYNDLLYLFMRCFERKKMKLAFVYDKSCEVNIIKSPIPGEEVAMDEVFATNDKLHERRLYKYHLHTPPVQPYTIAFVANPKIRGFGLNEGQASSYENDPIICDRDLFYRTVDRAMFSLETDPVIGRPEIWSRVRVVTVFNPKMKEQSGPQVGLVEAMQTEIYDSAGKKLDNNLLDPMLRLFPNVDYILQNSQSKGGKIFQAHDFDIIYALTASATQTRSTAHFSDWIENDNVAELPNPAGRAGTPFSFEIDPEGTKEKNKYGFLADSRNTNYPPLYPDPIVDPNYKFRKLHDFCAIWPGRIALNVLSARHKTYAHEFAHAMSSTFHGTIGDEYVDCFMIQQEEGTLECDHTPHFFINRIDRNYETMNSAMPIPVPKLFAKYNGTRYAADMLHPSAHENWSGYFPEKYDRRTPCIMDRDTTGYYHFDELLSAFIYDRMMAKSMRTAADCAQQAISSLGALLVFNPPQRLWDGRDQTSNEIAGFTLRHLVPENLWYAILDDQVARTWLLGQYENEIQEQLDRQFGAGQVQVRAQSVNRGSLDVAFVIFLTASSVFKFFKDYAAFDQGVTQFMNRLEQLECFLYRRFVETTEQTSVARSRCAEARP